MEFRLLGPFTDLDIYNMVTRLACSTTDGSYLHVFTSSWNAHLNPHFIPHKLREWTNKFPWDRSKSASRQTGRCDLGLIWAIQKWSLGYETVDGCICVLPLGSCPCWVCGCSVDVSETLPINPGLTKGPPPQMSSFALWWQISQAVWERGVG